MSYSSINNFGSCLATQQSNPLSYCAVSGLDSGFNHQLGLTLLSPDSAQCQSFMGTYCGNNWDDICEYQSKNTNIVFPNTMQQCGTISGSCSGQITKGQILIRNAAMEKYLMFMSGNCRPEYAPFDPTVANSPLIRKWVAGGPAGGPVPGCANGNCNAPSACVPIYGIRDPKNLDNDPVMNKILMQPQIAMDILVNIYNNARSNNTLKDLANTRLGRFFMSQAFIAGAKSGMY